VQAVKRNLDRFPGGLVFQLDSQNVADLKSQSVISSRGENSTLASLVCKVPGVAGGYLLWIRNRKTKTPALRGRFS
jgi:hypothetical protein